MKKESSDRDIARRADVFKALGHPARLQMVEELAAGERCVCDLAVSMQSESSFEAIFLLAGYAEAGRVPTALQLG
jgi:DNA-binding transcriptional ArsR family regulator